VKNQSSAIDQLDRYIRARYPVITILSHEESRVMASIGAVAERRGRRVVTWTCTQGLQQVRPEDAFNDWQPDNDLGFFRRDDPHRETNAPAEVRTRNLLIRVSCLN